MDRVLLIDQDRHAMEALGLAWLAREVGVVMTENVCEAVRALLTTSFSLIVADARVLRLTPREHATLFARVAPGVPVVVAVGPETSLEARVAYEVAGFTTVSKPLQADDVLAKAGAGALG